MLKIAVVGCGYWGKNLVKNLYELDALNTVCDISQNMLNLRQIFTIQDLTPYPLGESAGLVIA